MKKTTNIEGFIEHISDIKSIDRKKKGLLNKIAVTIVTADGQKLFGEVRNKRIPKFIDQKLKVTDQVLVKILFEGSEKDDKKYNNIFIDEIIKL